MIRRRAARWTAPLVVLLALAGAPRAWGQEGTPDAPTPTPAARLPGDAPPAEIVVEGGAQVVRPPPDAPALPPLTDPHRPGARTVIPREAFRDTQRTVADVLEQAPGVTVTRGGDGLSGTRVSIRGSRSDQVLILLDGVPLAVEADRPTERRAEGRSGADLAAVPLERVESIEIVRGAASSLYGPGAAAGAILIRTRRAPEPALEVAATAGSDGYGEGDVRWTLPLGRTSEAPAAATATATAPPTAPHGGTLTLHANRRRSEGRYVFFAPQPGGAGAALPDNPCAVALGDGLFERRCNASRTTTVEADWRGAEGRHVALLLERLERDGLGGVENPRPFGRELRDRARLLYEDAHAFGDSGAPDAGRGPEGPGDPGDPDDLEDPAPRLLWRATAELLEAEREENVLASQAELRAAFSDRRLGGELRGERWLGPQRIEAGAAAERQTLHDLRFRAARDSGALFGGWERHGAASTLEASLRHDAPSDLDGETTWRAGFSRRLPAPWGTDGWGIKGSHGTGFRPPTLYELHDPGAFGDVSVANPELRPERSTSTDGGPFFVWGDAVTVELLAFRQDVQQQIVAIPAPASPNQFRFENVTRTRTTGLEASLSWRGPRGLSADAAWTRQAPVILDNAAVDPRHEGNRVPGVPDERWNLSLALRQRGWHAWLGTRHSWQRWVDAANTRFLRPYTVHDAGLTAPLGRGWSLSLEGRNLGNATYAELENFPPPGRQWFATLRWGRGAS